MTDRTPRRGVLPLYLASATAARLADEGARVSLVLLALAELNSAAVGGLLLAVLLVPHVVAAPVVGVVVDRSRHPRWVLAALVLVFAASLFSVVFVLGRGPLWLVIAILLIGGSCGPAITGALTSTLPGLVGAARTPRAFGLDSMFYNVAGMAGPAVAGVMAAVVNPAAAQTLLAGSATLGAIGVAGLPIVAHKRTDAVRPGLLSGAREILREPTLRVLTLTSALGQVGPGALPVVAALLAVSLKSPASSGLLLAVLAGGAFVGSLLWTWRPIAPHRAAVVATASMIGIGLPLAVSAATPSIAVTAALFGLSGFFIGPFGSALFTARAQHADEAVRTQVFTIGAGLKVTASALGAAMIALVTDLPVWTLLLLVAGAPLLAGLLGTILLVADDGVGRRPLRDAEAGAT